MAVRSERAGIFIWVRLPETSSNDDADADQNALEVSVGSG